MQKSFEVSFYQGNRAATATATANAVSIGRKLASNRIKKRYLRQKKSDAGWLQDHSRSVDHCTHCRMADAAFV